MRWLTLIIGFRLILAPPLSSAEKEWRRVPYDQARLRINNNDQAYKLACWEKPTPSYGHLVICQHRARDSRAEKFFVIYHQLPPDYGFGQRYTLDDHLEDLYETPPELGATDHHSTGKTVYRVGEYQEKSG